MYVHLTVSQFFSKKKKYLNNLTVATFIIIMKSTKTWVIAKYSRDIIIDGVPVNMLKITYTLFNQNTYKWLHRL